MKKTCFDLSYDEGKKLEKEVKKTSYYHQLKMLSTGLLLMFVLPLAIIIEQDFENNRFSTTEYCIWFGFVIIFLLISTFKRFDIIKKYYDEKNSK